MRPDSRNPGRRASETNRSSKHAAYYRTCGHGQPPPNGEAWSASPIPAGETPTGPREHHCSAVRLSALQPPSLLETAAALPHVPGSPRLGVLRRLRPIPARSADDGPSPPPELDARQEGGTGTVPVFARCSIVGVGARLCPGGLATATPQHFTVASPRDRNRPPGEFPASRISSRDAPHPALIHQVRAGVPQGGVDAGSSRAPLRLACRTRTTWQYWHVPALSGLLPAVPGTSRFWLPPASTALLRQDDGGGLPPPLEQPAPHGAHSGKHKHHGLLVIALTDDKGRLLRVSAARPGRTSEITACRHDRLTGRAPRSALPAAAGSPR